MSFAFTAYGEFVTETCCKCNLLFAMSRRFHDERRTDHKQFFCPNGHPQHYKIGASDLEKERQARQLAEQRVAQLDDYLKDQREATAREGRRASAFKGQCTRIKRKVTAGLCPCCWRNFSSLGEHMRKQHPDWAPDHESRDAAE